MRREPPELQRRRPLHARRLDELLPRAVDIAIRRRAGMDAGLLAAWAEIAGPQYRDCTRPERIRWPKRASEDDPFEPGQLVIACDGGVALFLQHEIPQILERVNLYFGFRAVREIRIVQKPMGPPGASRDTKTPPLDAAQQARLDAVAARIEDPRLRESVRRLGAGVMAAGRRKKP